MKKKVVPTTPDDGGGEARDERTFDPGLLRSLRQDDDDDGLDREAPLSDVYTSRGLVSTLLPSPSRPTFCLLSP